MPMPWEMDWGTDAPAAPDPNLVNSLIQQESGGNPNAVSPKGAFGTMQLMPATAANPGFGVQPAQDNSDAENKRVGTDYLAALQKKYGNDATTLAAYNWGPGHVDKWIAAGANPAQLPAETRNYVSNILSKVSGTAPAQAEQTPQAKPWEMNWQQPQGQQVMAGQQIPQATPQQGQVTPPTIAPPLYGTNDQPLNQQQLAQVYNRKPPEESLTQQDFINAGSDPNSAIGEGVAQLASHFGMGSGNAASLGRDARDALNSVVGPLPESFGNMLGASLAPERVGQAALDSAMPLESIPSTADLKAGGGAHMQSAKASEATIAPEAMQPMVNDFKASIAQRGLADRKTGAIDSDLRPEAAKMLPKLEAAVQEPQTLQDLHDLRLKVDGAIDKSFGPNGKRTQDTAILTQMRTSIDDMIEAHPNGAEFMQGNDEYARAMKAQIIDNANNKLRAGLDPMTNSRAAMREVYNKYSKGGPFTKDELTAIRKAAGPGYYNPLNVLSKFGFGEGGNALGPMMGLAVEGILGLPHGSLLATASAARGVMNARTATAAQRVSEMIRAGGPVAQTRLEKLSSLVSPKVLHHIVSESEGARRVAKWVSSPSPATARAFAAYTGQRLGVAHMTPSIMSQVQEIGGYPANAQSPSEGGRAR